MLLAIVYAGTDEFHQSFTKGRAPAGLDVVIDGVGASTATALRLWWQSSGASPLKR